MIRTSEWTKSHCRTNTSIRRQKLIQKSRTVRVIVRDLSKQVNYLIKVILRKLITKFTRSISSTRIGHPVLMMNAKASKDKHINIWVDQEKLIYVR